MKQLHNHQVVFGRRVVGCARCAELAAGAAPVRWGRGRGRDMEAQAVSDTRRHFASSRHLSGGCGPVCTYGD